VQELAVARCGLGHVAVEITYQPALHFLSSPNMKTYSIRYSSSFFTHALYGVYTDYKAALTAKRDFIARCIENGQPAIAKSIEIV
jgi:hypothetical protein